METPNARARRASRALAAAAELYYWDRRHYGFGHAFTIYAEFHLEQAVKFFRR